MSTSDKNTSGNVYAFPAGRRNVEWYNSRILNDDNFRRTYQASLPSPAGNGTVILGYERASGNYGKLSNISFLIQGYYFYLDKKTDETLKAINDKIGVKNGSCWVYIYHEKIEGVDSLIRPVTDFYEFNCYDENSKFYGLYHGDDDPKDGALTIPIVVPDEDGYGDLDPAIDTTVDGWYYKPWFLSNATWAAGKFSDKNKIWVDKMYEVPHICVKIGTSYRWVPLGAVYKSSE